MTREQKINKAVLLSMIPHIVKASKSGLDADALAVLINKEQRLRAKTERLVPEKRKLKLVEA
jgi:hypothetical protein